MGCGGGLQLFPDSASVSLMVEEGDRTILSSAAAGVELQVIFELYVDWCRLLNSDNSAELFAPQPAVEFEGACCCC